jgi:glycerol-3-phosphate dehydrogenase subunit B
MKGASTPRDAIRLLAADSGHPYAVLAGEADEALRWLRNELAASGLSYSGDLDSRLRPVPTSIGATRRVAVVPAGLAAGARPWAAGERMVICGIAGFRDFWPEAIVRSLSVPRTWGDDDCPASVVAVMATLPGLEARNNLNGLSIARLFDDPTWRAVAIDAIARAVDGVSDAAGRVALPAVLGLRSHADVLDALRARLPAQPFEVPLVPPSVPGIRLVTALREALIRSGGRFQIGEMVEKLEMSGDTVTAVVAAAAGRAYRVRTEAVVLATGGIAGGGIVAGLDGTLCETVARLPVAAPARAEWFVTGSSLPMSDALEKAGIRVDAELRPIDVGGTPIVRNLRVAGSLIAGQRSIRDRCGEGVAVVSGRRAGQSLTGSLPRAAVVQQVPSR